MIHVRNRHTHKTNVAFSDKNNQRHNLKLYNPNYPFKITHAVYLSKLPTRHSYWERKLYIDIKTESLVVFLWDFLSFSIFIFQWILDSSNTATLTLAHICDLENAAEKCTVALTPKEKLSAPFAVDSGSPHFPAQQFTYLKCGNKHLPKNFTDHSIFTCTIHTRLDLNLKSWTWIKFLKFAWIFEDWSKF